MHESVRSNAFLGTTFSSENKLISIIVGTLGFECHTLYQCWEGSNLNYANRIEFSALSWWLSRMSWVARTFENFVENFVSGLGVLSDSWHWTPIRDHEVLNVKCSNFFRAILDMVCLSIENGVLWISLWLTVRLSVALTSVLYLWIK